MSLSHAEMSLITDTQCLVSATGRFGYKIATYDDGYGPLWIHRDSMGISGIVRAQTWEDAYGICEDEFFPEADETVEELVKEYGFRRRHKKIIRILATGEEREDRHEDYPLDKENPQWAFVRWDLEETPDPDAWMDNELFQEAFGFRPNGRRSMENGVDRDPIGHGIYAKDLNGDALDRLTEEMVKDWEITLQIEDEE